MLPVQSGKLMLQLRVKLQDKNLCWDSKTQNYKTFSLPKKTSYIYIYKFNWHISFALMQELCTHLFKSSVCGEDHSLREGGRSGRHQWWWITWGKWQFWDYRSGRLWDRMNWRYKWLWNTQRERVCKVHNKNPPCTAVTATLTTQYRTELVSYDSACI